MSDLNEVDDYDTLVTDIAVYQKDSTLCCLEPSALLDSSQSFSSTYLPKILKLHSFPGDRICWKCGKHAGDETSNDVRKIKRSKAWTNLDISYLDEEGERCFDEGYNYTLSMTGWVCSARCQQCKEAEVHTTSKCTLIAMIGIFVFIVVALLGAYRLIDFLVKDAQIAPNWLLSIPTGAFIGGAAVALGLLGISVTIYRKAQNRLKNLGVTPGFHPDCERMIKYLDRRLDSTKAAWSAARNKRLPLEEAGTFLRDIGGFYDNEWMEKAD